MTKKITPNLWFDNNGEEAANFYVSVFKDGEVLDVTKYENSGPDGNTPVTIVTFRLRNQEFMTIDGGPYFKFSEAVSFLIDCEDQTEVDYFWDALIADGGETSYCGWLKDKYGLSWQVVPTRLDELLKDPDKAAADRVMKAMLAMVKLDVAVLEAAYRGE